MVCRLCCLCGDECQLGFSEIDFHSAFNFFLFYSDSYLDFSCYSLHLTFIYFFEIFSISPALCDCGCKEAGRGRRCLHKLVCGPWDWLWYKSPGDIRIDGGQSKFCDMEQVAGEGFPLHNLSQWRWQQDLSPADTGQPLRHNGNFQ